MSESILNCRVVNKIDTAENWGKVPNFIPKEGEIVIYTKENEAARAKVGDGVTTISKLPFFVDEIVTVNKGVPTSSEESLLYVDEEGSGNFIINISGFYDNIQDLQLEHPIGEKGDCYIIGASKDAYIWDLKSSAWLSLGPFNGATDPTLTLDGVAADAGAVGRALDGKADKENDWVLIETIGMSKTGEIKRSTEPDGTPYNFDAMALKIDCPQTESGSYGDIIGVSKKRKLLCAVRIERTIEAGSKILVEFYQTYGYWKSVLSGPTIMIGETAAIRTYTNPIKFCADKSTEKIAYLEGGCFFPVGSTIEIWAVRSK